MRTIRSAAAVALVVIAVLGGGLLALATYSAERELSVGRIELSVQPFHRGALDLYVPLVDWGARFSAVRLPARLSVDVRTVDREAAERLAGGQLPDVRAVRKEARDALASYLRVLLAVVFAFALTAGLIMALAVRGHGAPRLRWLFATAIGRRRVLPRRSRSCSRRAARSPTPSTTRTGPTSRSRSGRSSRRRAPRGRSPRS